MEEIKFMIHRLIYFLLASSMFLSNRLVWAQGMQIILFLNQKINGKVRFLFLGQGREPPTRKHLKMQGKWLLANMVLLSAVEGLTELFSEGISIFW